MTREEFEKDYGEVFLVLAFFNYDAVKTIIPYFEEFNSILENEGKEPVTLDKFVLYSLVHNCSFCLEEGAKFTLDTTKTLYEMHKEGDNHE